jgi:hypothetical protein
VVARIIPCASLIDGYDVAENKETFFEQCDVISLHMP